MSLLRRSGQGKQEAMGPPRKLPKRRQRVKGCAPPCHIGGAMTHLGRRGAEARGEESPTGAGAAVVEGQQRLPGRGAGHGTGRRADDAWAGGADEVVELA